MCCIYENTNFESNSQQRCFFVKFWHRCVVSTKIQILKAIHNYFFCWKHLTAVVLYLRKYKFWKQFTTFACLISVAKSLCCIYENTNFESNSQPRRRSQNENWSCVVSTKIQILKAIHNCTSIKKKIVNVVLYLRKYKFWKQFTTIKYSSMIFPLLCCIYENTNFESNSQLQVFNVLGRCCCVVSTKIQILKAIHNIS